MKDPKKARTNAMPEKRETVEFTKSPPCFTLDRFPTNNTSLSVHSRLAVNSASEVPHAPHLRLINY